jgi:hypothetical protein
MENSKGVERNIYYNTTRLYQCELLIHPKCILISKRPDQWMNKEYEQNSTARSSHATNHLFFCAIDRAGTYYNTTGLYQCELLIHPKCILISKRPDQWMNKEYEQNSTARSSHATNHLFFCAIDRAVIIR